MKVILGGIKMTRKNQAILYGWLDAILTAFWQGASAALGTDLIGPFVGISVPTEAWAKLKALSTVAIAMGVISVINILKQSPLPHFEFGVEDRIATVERHINAMTNVAVPPPKE